MNLYPKGLERKPEVPLQYTQVLEAWSFMFKEYVGFISYSITHQIWC